MRGFLKTLKVSWVKWHPPQKRFHPEPQRVT